MLNKFFRLVKKLFTLVTTETRIKTGAHAYSLPYGIDWGAVPSSLIGVPVVVGSRQGGYTRIDFPLWPKNQKPFWVKDIYVETITYEPPTIGARKVVAAPGNIRIHADIYDADGVKIGTADFQNEVAVELPELQG